MDDSVDCAWGEGLNLLGLLVSDEWGIVIDLFRLLHAVEFASSSFLEV